MKFSYSKNPESVFFYQESKSNKKIWLLGGEEVLLWLWLGLVNLFFRIQLNFVFFLGGEGKGKLASVSEFVLQRIQV